MAISNHLLRVCIHSSLVERITFLISYLVLLFDSFSGSGKVTVAISQQMESSTTLKKDRPILTNAPPPLHAVILVVIMTLVCLYTLPSWSNLDETATVETFTRRWFPDAVSLKQLAYIRWGFASIIWATTFQTACLSKGWQQTTSYLKNSKLIAVPNTLSGIKTMLPFTSWSWNFLGLAFSFSGYIAWKAATPSEGRGDIVEIDPWILRTALICWEIAAPFTFLVAAVIRYAIWPTVLQSGADTDNLKTLRNKLMHNINVLFALAETALLGRVPVRWRDVSLGPLVGCSYMFFSWGMTCAWNDTRKVGPQFIYFFFDTTIPGMFPSIVILALLFVLLLFYSLFVSAETLLNSLPGGFVVHGFFVAALSSVVMRFRD